MFATIVRACERPDLKDIMYILCAYEIYEKIAQLEKV